MQAKTNTHLHRLILKKAAEHGIQLKKRLTRCNGLEYDMIISTFGPLKEKDAVYRIYARDKNGNCVAECTIFHYGEKVKIFDVKAHEQKKGHGPKINKIARNFIIGKYKTKLLWKAGSITAHSVISPTLARQLVHYGLSPNPETVASEKYSVVNPNLFRKVYPRKDIANALDFHGSSSFVKKREKYLKTAKHRI